MNRITAAMTRRASTAGAGGKRRTTAYTNATATAAIMGSVSNSCHHTEQYPVQLEDVGIQSQEREIRGGEQGKDQHRILVVRSHKAEDTPCQVVPAVTLGGRTTSSNVRAMTRVTWRTSTAATTSSRKPALVDEIELPELGALCSSASAGQYAARPGPRTRHRACFAPRASRKCHALGSARRRRRVPGPGRYPCLASAPGARALRVHAQSASGQMVVPRLPPPVGHCATHRPLRRYPVGPGGKRGMVEQREGDRAVT